MSNESSAKTEAERQASYRQRTKPLSVRLAPEWRASMDRRRASLRMSQREYVEYLLRLDGAAPVDEP